jgi:hypothetical protein
MRGLASTEREKIHILIPCRSKVRKWAFENAYLLVVMAVMFAITWIALFIVGVKAYAG